MLAFLQTSMASAVSPTITVTDTLEISILPASADIELNSPDGSLVTEPNYNLRLLYNGVKDLKLKVINYDSGNNVLYEGELWTFAGDYEPGVKNFALNLDDLGGYGNFTFEATGVDRYGVPVEKTYFMIYRNPKPTVIDGGYIEADPGTGNAEVDIDIGVGVVAIKTDIRDENGELVRVTVMDVESGNVDIYDGDGNLLFTVPKGIKDEGKKFDIPLAGLEYGTYTADVVYLDRHGETVGNIYRYRIGYRSGPSVPVPDTGGFSQDLNISREDYLITGALMLATIGVVVFAVMRKNS